VVFIAVAVAVVVAVFVAFAAVVFVVAVVDVMAVDVFMLVVVFDNVDNNVAADVFVFEPTVVLDCGNWTLVVVLVFVASVVLATLEAVLASTSV